MHILIMPLSNISFINPTTIVMGVLFGMSTIAVAAITWPIDEEFECYDPDDLDPHDMLMLLQI